jgi:isocitrate dehydrogenase kinase/phosphatase
MAESNVDNIEIYRKVMREKSNKHYQDNKEEYKKKYQIRKENIRLKRLEDIEKIKNSEYVTLKISNADMKKIKKTIDNIHKDNIIKSCEYDIEEILFPYIVKN